MVGDVHGNIHALERAIDWLERWHGTIIFLGDYVNRGAHSRDVLDALVTMKSTLGARATFLLGNHDLALRDFVGGGPPESFLAHGGLTTLHSYIGGAATDDPFVQLQVEFPSTHRRFLNELELCWESPEMVVAHAGVNPERPESRTQTDLVLGSYPTLFDLGVLLPKVVVAGHYAQRNGQPFFGRQFVCVDSGCGVIPGAPLSIVLFPSREVLTF